MTETVDVLALAKELTHIAYSPKVRAVAEALIRREEGVELKPLPGRKEIGVLGICGNCGRNVPSLYRHCTDCGWGMKWPKLTEGKEAK